MKKRFMAALLSLCLLMGMITTVAYAFDELGEIGDLVDGDGQTGGAITGDDLIIEGGPPIIMPSVAGGSVIVDTLDTTTGDGYAEFDTEADIAYSKSIDIYAQAFDSAITNAAATPIYKVEIVWGDMAFAWGATDEIEKIWDPRDHTYSDDADTRELKWYLLDDSALTKLEYNTDGTYDSILTDTKQNYVLIFNHSNAAVNANIKLTDIYQNVEDTNNIDGITATLTQVDDFGTTANKNDTDGSLDYALNYDIEKGVVYSKTNGTAAAAYVELANPPADGVLNNETSTTVARITVTIDIPNDGPSLME